MPSQVGTLSIEETLSQTERALEQITRQREEYTIINDIAKSLNGQAKEMSESGHVSIKNMERLSEVMNAYSTVVKTNVSLSKEEAELQDKISKLRAQQTEDIKKASELSKQETDKLARQIGEGVISPIKGISSAFEGIISKVPMLGSALIALSPLLNEFAKSMHEIRSITYTGGMGGLEGMGGVGGIVQLQSQMRIAALEIPGIKERYASREEMTAGAGTMFGMGGLRGDELTRTMEDLPRVAHEVGMRFTEVSEIFAKSHRVLKQSPEEMRAGFQEIIDSAKEAGASVRDYAKAVYSVTMDIAHYGYNQSDVNKVLKDYYHLIESGSMSLQDFNAFMKTESQARKSSEEAWGALFKTVNMAEAGFYKVSDAMNNQRKVTETLTPVVQDTAKALEIAEHITPMFNKSIVEGTMQMETLTGVLPELVSKYRFTDNAMSGWMLTLTNMSKETGIAAPELAKNIISVSNSMSKMFDSPREALNVATDAIHSYGRMIKNGQMTMEDFTRVVQSNMDVQGASRKTAVAEFDTLASIVKRTNMRMEELVQYTTELAKVNKQYGYDVTASAGLVSMFGEQVRAGAISLQDIQTINKGAAGGTEGVRAMVAQRLGQAGAFGGAFSGGDVLTQIEMLRDLQEAMAPKGKISPLLERKGITKDMLDNPANRDIYNKTFQGIISEFTSQGGPEDAVVMFKKMAPMLYGNQITAVGGALDALYKLNTGEKVDVKSVLDDTTIERITTYQKKHKLPVTTEFNDAASFASIITKLPEIKKDSHFDEFGNSVRQFGQWVAKLVDPGSVDKFGKKYATPEEQALANLSRDASMFGIAKYIMSGASPITGRGGTLKEYAYGEDELRGAFLDALGDKMTIPGLTPERAKKYLEDAKTNFGKAPGEGQTLAQMTKEDVKNAVADGYVLGKSRAGGENISVTAPSSSKVSKQGVAPSTPLRADY